MKFSPKHYVFFRKVRCVTQKHRCEAAVSFHHSMPEGPTTQVIVGESKLVWWCDTTVINIINLKSVQLDSEQTNIAAEPLLNSQHPKRHWQMELRTRHPLPHTFGHCLSRLNTSTPACHTPARPCFRVVR